ncbi:MAG: hypothetical protein IKE42_16040 [Aquamicrobium sp.]|nr:hypothetical protein [Aquamicrobium sp.]
MPGVLYRVVCVAALAGVLTGCGGIVPKGYQGKWSCTGPTLGFGQFLRIDIDGSTVSWSKMSMMPAWKAEVEQVSPDGDGHWLHLKGGPYGMVRAAMRPGGITLEGYRCSAA